MWIGFTCRPLLVVHIAFDIPHVTYSINRTIAAARFGSFPQLCGVRPAVYRSLSLSLSKSDNKCIRRCWLSPLYIRLGRFVWSSSQYLVKYNTVPACNGRQTRECRAADEYPRYQLLCNIHLKMIEFDYIVMSDGGCVWATGQKTDLYPSFSIF